MSQDAGKPATPRSRLAQSLLRLDDRADDYVRKHTDGALDGPPEQVRATTKRLARVLSVLLMGLLAIIRGVVAGEPAVVVLGVLVATTGLGIALWWRQTRVP
jgi:hypothetical protein